MILDSEDEQDKDDSPASFPAIPDMQPPSETPVEDTNTLRDLNGTPSLETLSPSGPTPSEQSLTQRRTCDPDIQAKEEVIDVVIKTEGGPDEFKRVTLIKSEDGSFDIWNVDGFGLGPTIPVDEKYNRGFTRKVISDAFGGGHMECYHNWKKPKPSQETKAPFLTFNRSWNNALPVSPGAHGMGFFGMSSSPTGLKPLNFLNNWRLSGTYDFHRWGEIATRHVSLLPPHVLDNWAHGMATTQWGKAAIEDANADLKDPAKVVVATKDSVLQAIRDGRITIPFTILRCVGYPQDWFERLLYYEKHPKPKKPTAPKTPRKRAGPKANGSPKKQARTSQKGKRKAVKVESASEASEEETDVEIYKQEPDDDEEYVGDHSGSRPIAGLPIRTSPRKMQSLRMSVEL
ncbi:hypothetical protein B0H10DRAFT_2030696 [Mycena sp. CBHHK59/15]|nr:hypothetical protein B0H10DRAFT_2030696 [Mycena sp. CBHHK59/15]